MDKLKKIGANLIKNPKTTAAGIASLVGVGFAVAANPALLASPQIIAAILGAIGLLVAADDSQGPKAV